MGTSTIINTSSQGYGHLCTQTHETRNCVVHYRRAADGALTEMERTATGGAGSGTFKPISGQESAPNLQRQPRRAQGADREAEGGVGVRVLPLSKRTEGGGLDVVLPAAGRPARPVTAAVSHVRPSRPCKRSGETAASSRSPFLGRDCLVRPHRRKRSHHFQDNGSHMGAESQ